MLVSLTSKSPCFLSVLQREPVAAHSESKTLKNARNKFTSVWLTKAHSLLYSVNSIKCTELLIFQGLFFECTVRLIETFKI